MLINMTLPFPCTRCIMIRTGMRANIKLIRKHPKIRHILRCESPYFHHCSAPLRLRCSLTPHASEARSVLPSASSKFSAGAHHPFTVAYTDGTQSASMREQVVLVNWPIYKIYFTHVIICRKIKLWSTQLAE